MLDLTLAILHHLLMFGLFAILVTELVLVRPGIGAAAAARIAGIDAFYGALAGSILIVGFCRAIFAAKGWDYYAQNGYFWAKIATFGVISLLSVPPTINFLKWRRRPESLTEAAVVKVRRNLLIQLHLFALLIIFAAAMARGYDLG